MIRHLGARPEILRDRPLVALLALGLVLNLALLSGLAVRYPELPPRLVVSYGPHGLADRIGARLELLLLPLNGLAVLLLNGVFAAWLHRRERVLALLLAGSGLLVQGLVGLALRRLVG